VTSLVDAQCHPLTPASMYRRKLLLGLGAISLSGVAVSCVTDPGNGAVLTQNGVLKAATSQAGLHALERLKRAGQRLPVPLPRSPTLAWEYGILLDDLPVAAIITGTGFLVSTGLILLCENDGQIAAVLAQRVAFVELVSRAAVAVNLAEPLNIPPASVVLAQANSDADIAAIGVMARAGFEPRDALQIWQRIGRIGGDSALPLAARLDAMAGALRKMGYQV
jgi:hypothetical protein